MNDTDTAVNKFIAAESSGSEPKNSSWKLRNFAFFKAVAARLDDKLDNGENIDLPVRAIIDTLLSANRYLDIANLYNHLRHMHDHFDVTGKIFPVFKYIMQQYARDYFLRTLTYRSGEIDMFLHDLLGDDTSSFLEIMSLVFREHHLYNTRLSSGVRRKIVEIADEGPRRFIEHADVHFLAFFFSMLPHISPLPEGHIRKWTEILLSENTRSDHIGKIIDALRKRPSPEILFIIMLSPKTRPRGESLRILTDHLPSMVSHRDLYTAPVAYFLQRVLMSEFYDFDQIPRNQKKQFLSVLTAFPDKSLCSVLSTLLERKNSSEDPKFTESQIMFVHTIGTLQTEFPGMSNVLRDLLDRTDISADIKRTTVKILKEIAKRHIGSRS